MEILRTPDQCFADLSDYPWRPHFLEDLPDFTGLRLHYLDEGPRDAPRTFLCLHGQPTWSYLYRRMIPPLLASGARVIAPDLFGFGRSDKPVDEAFYTFTRHRASLLNLVERLDLRNVVLVVQDWGGLLGLTLPLAASPRYIGVLLMNTALGTGDVPLGEGFLAWRAYANSQPDLDIPRLMRRSCAHLSLAEAAAYGAPYPDARYKAGVRRFPNLVPEQPGADGAEISRAARTWWRTEWTGRSFMAIGGADPVLGPPVMNALRKLIRNCPEPLLLEAAGHFVQEWGESVLAAALPVLEQSTPNSGESR